MAARAAGAGHQLAERLRPSYFPAEKNQLVQESQRWQVGAVPLRTLIFQARARIEAAIADNAELSKRVHRTNSTYLTDERTLEFFGRYFAGSACTEP